MASVSNFPVMFIDPVYATVTSKTHTQDVDSEEWIVNSGMTGGIIKFLSQGAVRKRTNVSYFVKMSKDTTANAVAEYMEKAWKLSTPNIILSVISSPDNWKKWMNERQKEDFQKGIIEAVNTTSMWLLTNGANSGVCKLIGDAIKMEKERRHLLATNYSTKFLTSNKLENLPKITAIGIIPTSELSCSEELDREDGEITIEMNHHRNMSESVILDPDLTNFVLMDQIQSQKESHNRRLTLEERFRQPVGKPRQYGKICDIDEETPEDRKIITSTSTPLVGLLIQGNPFDIEHVCNLIKMKVPVVIVKGTGAATDLFSFAYDEIQQRPKEDHLNSYVKPELLKRIHKVFPNEFKDDELARNRCRDMIIECVQFSMRVQQNFLTILDPETDPNGLKNLDKYILLALFESQEPKKGSMFQEQIQSDLKLTLDWNRCDLALSQIFQRYDWINIKISRDLLDFALVTKDRHRFVELFLDKQAIELHRYFNFKKLLYLINNYEDSEFFRTVCLGEVLGYSPVSDYPVSKRFIYGDKSPLNTLLYKTTYLSALISFTDFGMEEMEQDVANPAVAERKAINTLVYWAALNYDPELTKTLWKKTEEPMAMAIIVNMIWHNLARRWCPDSDTKRKLLASAKEFEKMAVNLLEYSYQDSNFNTIALLDKRLEDFNHKTVIELAHMARNKHFIAHYVCQRWLNRRWFGNLLIRKYNWGPIKIPNWAKIYLSLVLIFPMFIWITYDLADKKRRDRIIEDDLDDQSLVDEAGPRHTPSVLVDKWLISPSETIAFKMRSVWNYGKERFKVPVHLQFYYLWSAPITKFWLNQIFYILFLVLFSVATLHPNCGMIYLDLAVFGWVLMIWIELVRSTFSKWRKYKELDLFWTILEIFVMAFLLMVILTVRITPYFVTYFSYLTTKFMMSLGLLYFYYRVLIVFLPISPVLGPMLISIKRMITHDFLTWFRMFLIIMVSGAVTIHSVLYPNYPLIGEGIKLALSRAFFAMFLTKIDDLEGDTCSAMYRNTSVSHCYTLPHGSFYTDDYNPYVNNTSDEEEYRRLAKCPYSSLGGYLVVIQYLLIVKLIMVTLLYALFSNTNAKVQDEAEAIWKFQKYSLIVDFEERLILPPPLNCISYVIMLIEAVVRSIKYCYRRCCKGHCCKKKQESPDGPQKISILMMHRSEEYSYWGSFVRKLDEDEEQVKADKNRTKTQSQMLDRLMNKFLEQKEFDDRLVEKISNLEQNVVNCQVALEKIQHTIEKLNPHLQPTIDSNKSFIHVLSRQSPYPRTSIQRFPVMDKYVHWKILYSVYDPVVYSCPVGDFHEQTQPYVDPDYLKSIKDSPAMSISHQDIRDIGLEFVDKMPTWNTASKVTIAGQEKVIDRGSFIKDEDEIPVKYELDTYNLPINPKGRTGLRGRGNLLRWGPNHNVIVVITRWKKKDGLEDFIEVDGKKLLEVIAIQKKGKTDHTLPRGGDYGYTTMYSAVCKKFLTYTAEDTTTQINPDMNSTDMIEFFRKFFPLQGPLTPFTTDVIFKGYFDDPSNTDNAWREVEVWNFHFEEGGTDIDAKLKNKEKKWRTVSSYNTFHGSQDLILRQAATLHNAYY